jgi:hypothetical protein
VIDFVVIMDGNKDLHHSICIVMGTWLVKVEGGDVKGIKAIPFLMCSTTLLTLVFSFLHSKI